MFPSKMVRIPFKGILSSIQHYEHQTMYRDPLEKDNLKY